jgi:hypothetical protein
MTDPRITVAREELRATLVRAGAAIGVRADLAGPNDLAEAGPNDLAGPARPADDQQPPGLVLATEHLADPADPTLDAALAVTERLTGVRDERVLATWLQGWIAWWGLGPAAAAWLLEGRVAPLSAGGVIVTWDGAAASVTIASGAWADDPDRTGDALHDRLVATLEPMVTAFAARRRVGIRQQWLQTADRLAAALQIAARAAGREADAVPASRALLGRPGSPLRSPRAGFSTLGPPEAPVLTWVRGTCCLAWQAPAAELCPTCPATPSTARGGTGAGPRPAAARG